MEVHPSQAEVGGVHLLGEQEERPEGQRWTQMMPLVVLEGVHHYLLLTLAVAAGGQRDPPNLTAVALVEGRPSTVVEGHRPSPQSLEDHPSLTWVNIR